MSRLKELRLHGFKTFADPTRFAFEPGITAVIGPNGSGKSNMADAVRWVLGEQSNRTLRMRKADDVVFAGSQQRRPKGMAEAVLVLDNSDRWLPIDYAEVSIGRRAYRSGETEYVLNGSRVRLRDVTQLLSDGRLGASDLIVVGQGTVDAALSLRPEERRQLFEEAAGVKGLQVRKNESLSKLDAARDNLVRVRDLVAEIKPQVRRLALQAEHQDRHDRLAARARALLLESHRRREASEHGSLADAVVRANSAAEALATVRARQLDEQRVLGEASAAYWEAESHARTLSARREAAREAVIRAEAAFDAAAGRAGEVEAARAVAQRHIAEAERRLSEVVARAPVTDDAAAVRTARAEADAAADRAGEALAHADRDVAEAEDALSARRAAAAVGAEARWQLEDRARRSEARAAELEQVVAEIRESATAADASAETSRAAAAAARTDRDTAARALAAADDAVAVARRTVEVTEATAASVRSKAREIAERLGGARDGDGIRARLTRAGFSPLENAILVPPAARAAVAVVLGCPPDEAIVGSHPNPADLVSSARGTARVVATGVDAGDPIDRAAAFRAVGATATLADWIGAPGALALFARTVVAPDARALVAGWQSLPAGWAAVTQRGDLATSSGLIVLRGESAHDQERESPPTVDSAHLSGELADLEAQADAADAAAERARSEHDAAASRRGRAGEAALAAETRWRTAEAEAEADRSAMGRARRDLAELDVQLRQASSAAVGARDALAAMPDRARDDVGTLERRVADLRASRARLAAERDAARALAEAARFRASELGEHDHNLAQEHATLEVRLAAARESLRVTLGAIDPLVGDRDAAAKLLAEARVVAERATAEHTVAEHEREQRREALLAVERGAGDVTMKLADLETETQAAAVDLSRHEYRLAALQRELELALEGLADAPELPEVVADVSLLTTEQVETELRTLRKTLAQLGSVNPFAHDEHRELARRVDDLSAQEADLDRALRSTEALIAQLEGEIAERFGAALSAIGERFDEFVRLLFAGGSASLATAERLDGQAPAIEISVRPPGKRSQRLEMLSGGERALAGVALLFAMLSVNPVPFCLLDEVDAALDEANVARFAEALRRLSESTDFVVITHNRATIEMADTIYGVTMTDAAVSRIVSLRLSDVALAAAV
ncbi:MAG: chromosome segregation protein SMC [Candidatus Limnocylindria bacterium]